MFESDTDDTSSSVSTIIERGSYSHSSFTGSHFNTTQYLANALLSDNDVLVSDTFNSSAVSIVDRVLSPFERLECELDSETAYSGTLSLTPFTGQMMRQSDPTSGFANMTTSSQLSNNCNQQCQPNKTVELISDDLLSVANNLLPASVESDLTCPTPSDIHSVDIDSRREAQKTKQDSTEILHKYSVDNRTIVSPSNDEDDATDDVDQFANEECAARNNTDQVFDASAEHSKDKGPALNGGNVDNDEDEDDEDEDEDFDLIKDDIISRVDDDKDDFMLDTDYLNESSSRFLYHHSGSELILTPYSELSSITEEDEEEDTMETKSSVDKVSILLDLDANPFQIVEDVLKETKPSAMSDVEIDDGMDDAPPKCQELNVSPVDKVEKVKTNDMNDSDDKVNLNNVFEFLNEATDDFEFVERMLELTNDKIDSIDDIMRIKESIRGLQQSEKRENLERFLDSKDVIDELMALSSSSNSSASSIENECHLMDSIDEMNKSYANEHKSHEPKSLSIINYNDLSCDDDFTSLPVCINSQIPRYVKSVQEPRSLFENKLTQNSRIMSSSNSKIPTLNPKSISSSTPLNGTLKKRSHSVANIFNQSNRYNSMIELRPSLIPRPISNFNLALPSETSFKPTPTLSRTSRFNSHNCLNRSTSMQSIFSNHSVTNSLPRPTLKPKPARRRSQPALTNGSTGSNYHHNCLRNHHDTSTTPLQYGSLSRSISKSSHSVYHTGSLPRATVRPNCYKSSNQIMSQAIPQYNPNLRTASLVDLTYGKCYLFSKFPNYCNIITLTTHFVNWQNKA